MPNNIPQVRIPVMVLTRLCGTYAPDDGRWYAVAGWNGNIPVEEMLSG